MPTANVAAIKCAELFWKTDSCQMEYRCISCEECFYTHADCFWHVQGCLLLAEARNRTAAAKPSTRSAPTCTETSTRSTDEKEVLVDIKEEESNEVEEIELEEEYTTDHLVSNVPDSNEESAALESNEEFELEDCKDNEEYEIDECNDDEEYEIEKCKEDVEMESADEQFETIEVVFERSSPVSKVRPKETPTKSTNLYGIKAITSSAEKKTNDTNNDTTLPTKNPIKTPYAERKSGLETASQPELQFSRQLLLRMKQKRSSVREILECDLCGVRQKHRHQMLKHMHRVHIDHGDDSARKKYCCEVCGKQFTELGNLKVHTRIHTGEKPFPCLFEECERRFLTSSERKIHMRVHSGEKPYQCTQCPKQFHNKNHMNMHMRTVHSNERPFQCEMCGRSFKIREIYKKHLLTHSNERPYHCDVCGLTFRQRSAFQVHQNIHSDHRPFKCGYCERGFHSSAARRSHEKLVHKAQ